jgi:adenylate cyclase
MNQARSRSGVLGRLKPWQRFHNKLSLAYGGVMAVVVIALSAIVVTLGVESATQSVASRALATATTITQTLASEAITRSPRELAGLSARLMAGDAHLRGIYGLRLSDTPGTYEVIFGSGPDAPSAGERYLAPHDTALRQATDGPVAHESATEGETGATITAFAPWKRSGDRLYAIIGVTVDARQVIEMRDRMLGIAIMAILVLIIALILVSRQVARQVEAPFRRLLEAIRAIDAGDYDVRLRFRDNDEFAQVAGHFNSMAKHLSERTFMRETLGRYMSEEVAQVLLDDPHAVRLGGELREVTIFFSDIRGYSTVSERLTPSEVVDLINAYFTAMHEVIDRHHGSVIEYLGDGMLVAFGAPVRHDDHAEHAVRCALAMGKRLHELNATWGQSALGERLNDVGLDRLTARIGIHTGTVVAGNLGSPHRMKYGVIGDAVNLAARLEVLNKDLETAVLLSDKVYQRLPEELRHRTTVEGVHQVKGRDEPVGVFSIR